MTLINPHMDPDQLKDYQEKKFWLDSLASLGGMAGGAALGTLAINPVRYFEMRQAEKEANMAHENFQRNKEILRTLSGLHSGNVSWDDVTPEARPALESLYQEHQGLLNNPAAMAEHMRARPPAEVVRLPGTPKIRLAQLLPTKEMLAHPMQTITNPIPATLGLIGGAVAGYAMDRHNEQRFYDLLKQQSEGGS